MKQIIQCPSCNTVFKIEMEYGKETQVCPSCGAELDVTAVFNGLGEALSITTETREKGTKHSENKSKIYAIDASGVNEIARMQEYITNLKDCLWWLATFTECKENIEFMPMFTESGSREEFCIRRIYDFIKEHRGNKEENK